MKKIFTLAFIIFFSHFCHGQTPFSDIIEKKRGAVVPVIGSDVTFRNNGRHLGTGFIVSLDTAQECFLLVTCAHVVTIKDSNQKVLRNVEHLFVNLNSPSDSVVPVKARVMYRDDVNDFALLELDIPDEATRIKNNYKFFLTTIPISHLDDANNLKEGETLLYIGYPMSLGVGIKSYPISRSGFVSQNIKDSSKFLMDGFSQGGYSGSPVFRIKQTSLGNFVIKVMGIVQAYPVENAIVKSKNSNDLKVIINPGFTIVGKLTPLITQLKKMHCKYN